MNCPKRIPSTYISLYTILFCLTFAACKEKKEKPKGGDDKKDKPTIVDVMVATSQPVTNVIEANGTIIPGESTELRPEVSGRLTYLNVPEGKSVAEGTVMARINSADLEAQVKRTKVQLETATKTEERLRKLLEVNGINQSDYDAALNTVNTLKADIAYTQTLIDKTIIRAPFTGTVGLRQVSPGAYVTPTSILATMQQLGKMKIDFTLPEENSDLIRIGSVVKVKLEGRDTTMRKATVIALEPQANRLTRNLMVRALLDDSRVNPGAFAKVIVSSGNNKKAIMIPTNAIIPDDRNSQVILVKGGKASFVNVQTGLRTANNVEITQGISEGDSVVVTGVLFAKPDAILKVRKATKR
ncbi:efflux RND transporter periplasmic adaptor subunit [Runella salmonicolor]|uniref:Efflux RND transporter periplasmic adaptor subunit n=1 Tax=Runella salmonicolor TaxID=2950278 RepID=A0ABT1FT53_9BACT|nr:efflux RND transporter periplasmic adaptor subunit [Runella salmonicolor]MCP1384949.1 efflux RND transporter periplasmic adaptor subunit [Runella salmonicolor]